MGNPTYELLFVSPEELDEVRREIAQNGTARNVLYQRAVAEHEKKGGK